MCMACIRSGVVFVVEDDAHHRRATGSGPGGSVSPSSRSGAGAMY
jgi:hypothetical protein